MISNPYLVRDRLLFLIIILLGFQQFPIIRAGGSFKTYELLGFILLIYNLIYDKQRTFNKVTLYAFLFFLLVPIASYTYSSIFFEYPTGYYMRWPKANNEFKASYYVFPLLLLFYMAMNYTVFKSLVYSNTIYKNFTKLIKVAVVCGTIISIYSLFALFVYDFIKLLPETIQFKHTSGGTRSTGLSQEPGTYILYQIWICLFLWYTKKEYKYQLLWYFLFIINGVSMLLTQSTAIWGFAAALIGSLFVFQGNRGSKVKAIFGLLFIAIAILFVIRFFNYEKMMNILFVKKVNIFVNGSGHKAIGSGGVRKYFSDIGYRIFLDYPFLGVGYGRSAYYMYLYQYKMGISIVEEPMFYGSTPLSFFSIVPSEMGIIGSIIFILFYFNILKIFWKNRNKSKFHKMFLIGCFTELIAMFSLYTPHAVFLWAYLGLGIGYIRFFDSQMALNLSKEENLKVSVKHSYQ